MRILLVEDEPHAARMLAKGLREQAYAVDVAPDGERLSTRSSIRTTTPSCSTWASRQDGLEVCRSFGRG